MRCCQLCLLVSFGLRVRGLSNGTLTVARADTTSARRRLSIDYQEVAKLVAADGAADDDFGYSVAIDGNTIVVGAYRDDIDGGDGSTSGQGSVYVCLLYTSPSPRD